MIYFNNAATSFPKPAKVLKAVADNLEQVPFSPHRENRSGFDPLNHCRHQISRLFNFDRPERVVLCSSATEALNMAIHGLVNRGDHVVTTCLEHNSVLRPLAMLQADFGLRCSWVGCQVSGRLKWDDLQREVGATTRLVIVNHCSNVTGFVQGLNRLYEICDRYRVPLLLDCSQSAGCCSIDLADKPRMISVFTGHKALLGPQGTGGMVVGQELSPKVWKSGGTGIKSDIDRMPEEWPIKYQAGTPNQPGLAGLAAALDWILEWGVESLARKRADLSKRLCDGLEALPGFRLYCDSSVPNGSGVVSFTHEAWNPADLGYLLLESYDIRLRTGLHCAPLVHKVLGTYPHGTVRVSLGPSNTPEEVNSLLVALAEIVKDKGFS
jgi:cysteine desulfurase family protein